MKVFAFISIAFVFLIGFGVIYTQWETKNFVESLPKPLSTSDAAPETQRDSSMAAPDAVEETQQARSEHKPSISSVATDSNSSETEVSRQELVNAEVPTTENVETQSDVSDWQNDDAQPHRHPPQKDPWQSAEDRKTLRREGPNITPEALRSQLVGRFGDIPEVHTFVELDQKRNQGQPLTLDEYILYNESMNHLFPNKNTEQTIKKLKEIQQMHPSANIVVNQED